MTPSLKYWGRLTIVVMTCLISSLKSYAQTECNEAESEAYKDFTNKKYTLHSEELLPPNTTFLYVLEKYYHVKWRFADQDYQCYDSIITSLINEKVGHDFIKRSHQLSDSLEKTENWKVQASYKDGEQSLYQQLIKQANMCTPDLDSIYLLDSRVFVALEIAKTGEVKNISILKGGYEGFNKCIVKALEELGQWQPAYEFGAPINSKMVVPILFHFE